MLMRTLLITIWLVVAGGLGVVQFLEYRSLTEKLKECGVEAGVLPEKEIAVGLELPTFETLDMDARPVRVAPRGEGPSLLFVFEPGCPVCEETLPRWIELYDRLRMSESPVPVVGVSASESYATAQYVRAKGIPFPVVVFPDSETWNAYGVSRVPQTAVVGSAGRVEALWSEPLGDVGVEAILERVCPECGPR